MSTGRKFFLSWSHYLKLMRITNIDERHFYEIEAVKNDWSLSELKRQYNSSLYERLALSTDKEKVYRLSTEGADGRNTERRCQRSLCSGIFRLAGAAVLLWRQSWKAESLTIYSSFSWNLVQALRLSGGRNGSLLTKNISWWTWFFTIVCCAALSSST